MKILLSGGAGFIGSHLCDALLAVGHEVTVVDNLITGSLDNLAHLAGEPRFRFWEQDVCKPMPEDEWEAVLHLASPASPVSYGRFPVETLLVNSAGTHNLLERARRCRARFLLASTSEIYGNPTVHPQPEDYWGNVNPLGPRACYDEGKRFAEAITITYGRQYELDQRIVRIFNTYGPRNQPGDGRVIPNFVVKALKGEPITIWGDGQQTRSFCYVSDLVDGIMRVLLAPGATGLVINLGRPQENTILEVANLVKEITGSASPIVHGPARDEEIDRRCPDISRAQQVLQWEPKVELKDGLKLTINWFQHRLSQNLKRHGGSS